MSEHAAPIDLQWDGEAEQWIAVAAVPGPAGTVVFRSGCAYLEFDRVDPDVLTRVIVAPDFGEDDQRLLPALFEGAFPEPGSDAVLGIDNAVQRTLSAFAVLDDDGEYLEDMTPPAQLVYAIECYLVQGETVALGVATPLIDEVDLRAVTAAALDSRRLFSGFRSADQADPASLEWLSSRLEILRERWPGGSTLVHRVQVTLNSVLEGREAAPVELESEIKGWFLEDPVPTLQVGPSTVVLAVERAAEVAERLFLSVMDEGGLVFGTLGQVDPTNSGIVLFELPEALSLTGTTVRVEAVSLHEQLRSARADGVRASRLELVGSGEAASAWSASATSWLASGAKNRAAAAFRSAARTATTAADTRRFASLARSVLGETIRPAAGMWCLFSPVAHGEHRSTRRRRHAARSFQPAIASPAAPPQWFCSDPVVSGSASGLER